MVRDKNSLDEYRLAGSDMEKYLYNYGRHFNKHLYEFAVSKMFKDNGKGRESIKPLTKDMYHERMGRNGVTLDNDVLYDGMYVMSMAESDFLGSSIVDEKHLCLFVKDYIDDPDQADGFVFNRFLASIRLLGEPVDWYSML